MKYLLSLQWNQLEINNIKKIGTLTNMTIKQHTFNRPTGQKGNHKENLKVF